MSKTKLVVRYPNSGKGKRWRKEQEIKLFAEGYVVAEEENVSEWNGLKTLIFAVIFLPLLFFGYESRIKVTYEREILTTT